MKNRPLIIAHRGGSFLKHENTFEAFDNAVRLGADMIEFDVRKTKDEKLVIHHNPDIDGEKIADHTYDELLGITKRKGFELPGFEEVIKRYQGKVSLDIELKESGYEERILEIVKRYLDYDSFIIKSFHDSTIKRIKELDSRITAGLLLGKGNSEISCLGRISEIFPKKRLLETKADFVSPNYKLLNAWLILHSNVLEKNIYVWTVNEPKMMEKFKDKVTGIITDRPDLAIEVLGKR